MKYRESSLILDIYTEEFGLRSYIISGIRSKSAKTKSGILQLMSLVELLAYHKNSDGLSRIKEIKALHFFNQIPFNIVRSTLGMFIVELCKKSIREKEKNIRLFSFLWETFEQLDNDPSISANFHLLFMLKLSSLLGFLPNNNHSNENLFFHLADGQFVKYLNKTNDGLNEEISLQLHLFLSQGTEISQNIKMTKSSRYALLDGLIKYYQLHIDGFGEMRSLQILKDIFN